MIRAGILFAGLLWACSAHACPEPAPDLLFHSCWGEARATLVLRPDEPVPARPSDAEQLTVTGVYTGRDTRPNGSPNPVGLFIDGGAVINPTLARMDGILVIEPSGALGLHHRERVPFDGAVVDLTNPSARITFAQAAAAQGLSVAQSHLLVVDGRLDVRDREGAPRFVRRLLFTDDHGFGLWQSGTAQTLFEAGKQIVNRLAPRMALNLDMGSYDICRRENAVNYSDCAHVPPRSAADYSNLLVMTLLPIGT